MVKALIFSKVNQIKLKSVLELSDQAQEQSKKACIKDQVTSQ